MINTRIFKQLSVGKIFEPLPISFFHNSLEIQMTKQSTKDLSNFTYNSK